MQAPEQVREVEIFVADSIEEEICPECGDQVHSDHPSFVSSASMCAGVA